MASEETFSISDSNKLEGTFNYGVWKIKMRMILREKKLWYYVCPQDSRIIVEIVDITPEIEQKKKDKALTNDYAFIKGQCVASCLTTRGSYNMLGHSQKHF